jgi:VWFA-related protein
MRPLRGSALAVPSVVTVAAAFALVALLAACSAFAQEVPKRRGFSIKITEPVNQDFVIGKTKIAAEVKIDKPESIEKVEFYIGDRLIFIDQEAPYECFYDFGPDAKELIIKAIAYHKEGITVSDFIVTRKLDMSYAVRVNRVVLDASVFDKDGNFVSGLARTDFIATEEGVQREIIDFAPETRPILMGILIDVSGSMQERMPDAQKAAAGFVDTLRDTDRAMLVEFSEKVYLLSDLSNDHEALKQMISTTVALGGTAMYDAIHTTLRRLAKYDSRKAIVLLSDGDDTQSQSTWKKVLDEAKAGDVTIYTIGLGGGFSEFESRTKLKELADQTGGRFFTAGKASELDGVYSKIAEELRSQYLITYASENEVFDGRWMPIKLECKKKGLEVRTRKGYYAVPRGG